MIGKLRAQLDRAPGKPWSEYKRDALMHVSRRLNYPLAPPDWVSVNVTLRCNLACTMCTTCYPLKNELSYEELRSIIDQTAEWGIGIFNPLGGEPFLRPDMVPLLEHANERGLFCTVTTNGTKVTDDAAERLAAMHRVHMNVSLDGRREANDKIRSAGVYDKALDTIRRVRDAEDRLIAAGKLWHRKRINVNTIIHNENLEELALHADEMQAAGADRMQWLFLFGYDPANGRDMLNNPLWVPPERWPVLDRVIDELETKRQAWAGAFGYTNDTPQLMLAKQYYRGEVKPHQAPCYNGFKELYINADGRGLMCDGRLNFEADSFGNARTQTLKEMWYSLKAHEMREKVLGCTHACIQGCYLRPQSDDLAAIAAGASRLFVNEVRGWVQQAVRGAPAAAASGGR